jgi:hypothetical protein
LEEELPDHEIAVAEERTAQHRHETFVDDDALRAHLRSPHGLDAPEHLSRTTLEGLHDRLHDETDSAAEA